MSKYSLFSHHHKLRRAFTIVELIIVIVVIGILATIGTVAYNGAQKRALDASVLSDVDNMDGLQTAYGLRNNTAGKAYYSGIDGQSSELNFKPSGTNVIDVVINGTDYCIRGYNPKGNKSTIFNAFTKESSDGVCAALPPSAAAVDDSNNNAGAIWKAISIGRYHSCAISPDDKLYCWGKNDSGQLGNGTTTNSLVPVAVSTSGVLSGKTIKDVAVEDNSQGTCAIASDNKAYCWGENDSGQLGNGTTTNSSVPVAVSTAGVLSGKTITDVAYGAEAPCVLTSEGRAYCWGSAAFGRLGNGTTTGTSSVPVAVDTSGVLSGKNLVQIAATDTTRCAIDSLGVAYCWGYNSALGNGSTSGAASVPVAVTTSGALSGLTIKSISSSVWHFCVKASNNLPYCWGVGIGGSLGNGTTTNSSVPVAVTTSGALSGLTISYVDDMGVIAGGKIYTWGSAPIGDGSAYGTTTTTPTLSANAGLVTGKSIKMMGTGGAVTTCAIITSGQLYCWGKNDSGQLGNGTTTTAVKPLMVSSPAN